MVSIKFSFVSIKVSIKFGLFTDFVHNVHENYIKLIKKEKNNLKKYIIYILIEILWTFWTPMFYMVLNPLILLDLEGVHKIKNILNLWTDLWTLRIN